MGQLEDLMARRNTVAANIEKACNTGFDLNEELEKARSGVYADTAENRKMNRVGQKYGSEKKEEEPKGQREKKQEEEGSGKTVSEHAAGASDEALKRAAADDKASPEVKAAAEEEMKKRGIEKKEDESDAEEDFNFLEEDFELQEDMARYVMLEDEEGTSSENLKRIKNIEKNYDYKFGKIFEYIEEDEADKYVEKMEKRGYKVIDLGVGGDAYVYYLFKRKK